MAYFDANATTPLLPEAQAAWLKTTQEFWHNPSSPYRASAMAHNQLEHYREQLASLLNCPSDCLVFTAGATETHNAILRHVHRPGALVAISAIEHPSCLQAARRLYGKRCHELAVTPDGTLQLEALEACLQSKQPSLVVCQAANNETGVCQPWQAVHARCRRGGIPLLVDASQWLGKLPHNGLESVELVTGCAHKFGGPKQTGFLKLLTDRSCRPVITTGGEQEAGLRAGTENLPAIAAMVTAFAVCMERLETQSTQWQRGRDHFEAQLLQHFPGCQIFGKAATRLPNTSQFALPEHANHRWVNQLDRLGFQVATGSACATGKEGPSHVLSAMGIEAATAQRALRVSAGWETTLADWDALLQALITINTTLQATPTTPKGGSYVIEI